MWFDRGNQSLQKIVISENWKPLPWKNGLFVRDVLSKLEDFFLHFPRVCKVNNMIFYNEQRVCLKCLNYLNYSQPCKLNKLNGCHLKEDFWKTLLEKRKNYKKMIPLSIRENLLESKPLIAIIQKKSKWMIENAFHN